MVGWINIVRCHGINIRPQMYFVLRCSSVSYYTVLYYFLLYDIVLDGYNSNTESKRLND